MTINRHRPSVLLVAWLQLSVLSVDASDSGPLVTLKQGKYRGNFVTSPSGDHVAEYLGIPFAKPPQGNLRLANPEPVEERPDETFDAKKYASSCPQLMDTVFGNFSGSAIWNPLGEKISEDCLYLNVWAPQGSEQQGKTVMVWIYGGGFYSGTTALELDVYNGKTLAAFGDVIIVSINYRLGALGFLSTGDSRIAGNFGMMDQVLALTWIRKNIRDFGGDPEKVTIFGESAGAVSVTYHTLSPLSDGLFQRAIIESHAGDYEVFKEIEQARNASEMLLGKLKCTNDNTVLKCLRKLNYLTFLNAQWYSDGSHPFGPTLSPFMPKKPEVMLEEGDFKKRDILLGVNKNEGSIFMVYQLNSASLNDQVSGQTQKDIKNAIKIMSTDLDSEQREKVFDFYTDDIDEDDLVGNRDAIDRYYGDRLFACPSNLVAESNAESGGSTYFYCFNHRASNEVWPKWMGAWHGSEIKFVFGMPLNESYGFTREERKFSERLMTFFINFAKTGNPNSQGNSPWPKYTSDRKEFIELALKEKKHEGGYKVKECRFWDNLLNAGNSNTGQLVTMSVTTLVSLVLLAV